MADLIQKDIATLADELGMLEELTDGYALLTQKADGSETSLPASPGIVYSTTEKATSSKWIDGKTIYRKTINIGDLPNNRVKDVAHGIANLDKIISFAGFGHMTGYYYPLPFSANSTGYSISIFCTETDIEINTGSDRSAVKAYITLYYTKSA